VATEARATTAADLRARGVSAECTGGTPVSLGAEVCNRGTRAASVGQRVRFESLGALLCEGATEEVVSPGRCVEVRCAATVAAGATVVAIVNPDERTPECGDVAENASAPAVLACE
jgi:hypothetical protein